MEQNQTKINQPTTPANNQPIEWIDAEIANLDEENKTQVEFDPPIKMEENKLYEIEVNYNSPWPQWQDQATKTIKKIIPIVCGGQKMVFFLNVKNPLYSELLKKGKAGQRKFKVIRIGQAKATRYKLVE